MDPTRRVLSTERYSGSGELSHPKAAESSRITPVAINLAGGGSLTDIQAIEINGNEAIEEAVRRAFLSGQDVEDEVVFFCSDPIQALQMQMRLQRELENRQEKEAHDLLFKCEQFPVAKQQKPWKNHQSKSLQCLESTEPLPLSKIPPVLVQATKGLTNDDVTLLRAILTQIVFDCLDLKELHQRGTIRLNLPFDTFASVAATLYSTPKLLWDHQHMLKYGRRDRLQTDDAMPPMVSEESSILVMKILLGTMKVCLADAISSAAGKSKTILQSMLDRLSALETILVKKNPFPFANLRVTLGSICHDTKEPLFLQTPLEYLKTAKDMLYKVKKLSCHTLVPWKYIGGNVPPIVDKQLDLALRKIEQAIKFNACSPQQLLNLYKTVSNDLKLLKMCHGVLYRSLPQLAHHLAPFWGVDCGSLKRFLLEGETSDSAEIPEEGIDPMERMYSLGLVKLAAESIDLPCCIILRAFERSLAERGVVVSNQKVESFKEHAEKILAFFEELCSKHPLLQEKVFKVHNENTSLAGLIEHQRDELALISEVRLGAFASAEKVYYYGSVLMERFEDILIPFLKYKTKALVEKLPKFSQDGHSNGLNPEELNAFGELLVAIEDFLHVIETELPVLEDKLGEIFNLPAKAATATAAKAAKKPVQSKKVAAPRSSTKKVPVPKRGEQSSPVLLTSPVVQGKLPMENPSLQVTNTTSSSNTIVQEFSQPVLEQKAEVVVKEFAERRERFLESAKKLKAHIKETNKHNTEESSSDASFGSLRNVHWKELVKELTTAGWALVKAGGGHLQYKHPDHGELGRATIPSGSKDALSLGVVKNVRQQISLSIVPKQEKK